MFKSVQKTFLKKKKLYENKESKTSEITKIVYKFLEANYPEHVIKNIDFKLDYDPNQRKLVIQTNSKVFANDLILRRSSLHNLLEEKGQNLKEVVIR